MALKVFKVNINEVVDSNNSNRANETIVNLSKNNKSENLIYMQNIIAIEEAIFFIFNAKKVFHHL